MFDNTLNLTYNSATVTLTRVSEENFSSTYFGESGDDKLTLKISHTIPARGQSDESHLVRLDVEHYDVDGIYLRTSSAWTVLKTFNGSQNSTAVQNTTSALNGLLDGTFIGRVVARES